MEAPALLAEAALAGAQLYDIRLVLERVVVAGMGAGEKMEGRKGVGNLQPFIHSCGARGPTSYSSTHLVVLLTHAVSLVVAGELYVLNHSAGWLDG